jgi:hypothetical protein
MLSSRPITSAAEAAWETVTTEYLRNAFGSSTHHVESIMSIGRYAFAFGGGDETKWEEQRAKVMTERLIVLEALARISHQQD